MIHTVIVLSAYYFYYYSITITARSALARGVARRHATHPRLRVLVLSRSPRREDMAVHTLKAAKATFPFLNSSQVSIRVRDTVSGSTRAMNHCIFLLTSAGSNLDFGVII